VEIPFYFCQCLDNSAVFGRVHKNHTLTIHESYNHKCYEIEVEVADAQGFVCYLNSQHASSQKTFDEALERAKQWIASL
jgi:hypothetical protein